MWYVWRRRGIFTGFGTETWRKEYSEDLGVDGRIIFKEDPRDMELQCGD
jgi:hypothetical protein